MPQLVSCPDVSAYELMLTCGVLLDDAEALLVHLEACDACGARVRDLRLADTLIIAMAQASTVETGTQLREESLIRSLIERILQKARERSSDTGTATTGPMPSAPDVEWAHRFAPAQSADEIGRLDGYRILRKLGEGGMGAVFLAEDLRLKRKVALKVMKAALAERADGRERFLREAQAAAAIAHDQIVTIHQVGEDRGLLFLAMQLLAGESLDDCLKRQITLPAAEVIRIGVQIAEGLAAAHAKGLIHRDIKPANIWLEERSHKLPACELDAKADKLAACRYDYRVKILDFGLARLGGDEAGTRITHSGVILGTPAYMAPEQARGLDVDQRADLFSLGCTLYRMCTGVAPFQGAHTMAVLASLELDHPKSPRELNPDVPPALSDLVMRLLAKNREERPATAHKVIEALTVAAAASGGQTQRLAPVPMAHAPAPQVTPAAAAAGSGRYGRWPLALAASIFLAASALLAFVLIFQSPDGTLIVEIKDKDTEARFKNGELHIIDADGKVKYTLKPSEKNKLAVAPGDYTVTVVGADGLEVVTPTFEMKRRGEVTVRVTARPIGFAQKDPPKALPPIATGEPISNAALVKRPAKIAGVKSWTILPTAPLLPTNNIEFSPDNAKIVIQCEAGAFGIYELSTGHLRQALFHKDTDRSVSWSRDSKHIVTAGNGQADVWDAITGRKVRSLGKVDGRICAWSGDGKFVAIGFEKVAIWNVATGEVHDRLSMPASTKIISMSWSPKKDHLAAAGTGKLWIWDATTGKIVQEFKTGDGAGSNRQVEWSPDGSRFLHYLASENGVREIQLWDVGPGETHPVTQSLAKLDDKKVYSISRLGLDWAADGKTLKGIWASKGYWDVAAATWTQPLQAEKLLRVDPKLKSPTPRRWTLDGKIWLTAGAWLDPGGDMTAWSMATSKPVWTIEGLPRLKHPNGGPSPNPAISPDGKHLAVWSYVDQVLRLLEPTTGAILSSHRVKPSHGVGVAWLKWSPDSRRLYLQRGSGQVDSDIYDVETDRVLPTGPDSESAWSHDGKYLASRAAFDKLHVYDGATGKTIEKVGGVNWIAVVPANVLYVVGPIRFAPSHHAIALGSKKGLLLYDVANKSFIKTEETGTPVKRLAWTPDGKRVIGGDSKLTVWDAETGKIIPQKEPVAFPAEPKVSEPADAPRLQFVPLPGEQFIAISPEGHYRGTPNAARHIVYVVETDKGQEVLTPAEMEKKFGWKNDPEKVRIVARDSVAELPPRSGGLLSTGEPISNAALVKRPAKIAGVKSWTIETISSFEELRVAFNATFSPDNELLAIAMDFTVRIYKAKTGELVKALVGHNKPSHWKVTSLAWSRDGKHLASMAIEGEVITWEVSTGKRVASFRAPPQPPHQRPQMAWAADGKRLAIGQLKSVLIWDPFTGKQLDRFQDVVGGVAAVQWVSNKYLAVDYGHKIVVWDTDTAKVYKEAPVAGSGHLEASPNGTRLVHYGLPSSDRTMKSGPLVVYDVKTMKPEVEIKDVGEILSGHDHRQRLLLDWADDGQSLNGIFGANGYWDFKTAKLTRPLQDEKLLRIDPKLKTNLPLRWTSDAKTWLTYNVLHAKSQRVAAYSLETGKSIWSLDANLLTSQPANWGSGSLIISRNGKSSATLFGDANGKIVGGHFVAANGAERIKTFPSVDHVVWFPDGCRLYLRSAANQAFVYDVHEDKIYPTDAGVAFAISNDSKLIATRMPDGGKNWLRIADAETGKRLVQVPDDGWQSRDSVSIAFAPDRHAVAIGGPKGIQLYDVAKKTFIKTDESTPVNRLAWTPDGKRVIGGDSKLTVWDSETGRIIPQKEPVVFPVEPKAKEPAVFPAEPKAKEPAEKLQYVSLPNEQFIAISPEGHYRGTPNAARHIVYVVETDKGQETLTPAEMTQKYGWKNDPEKVRVKPLDAP